MNDTTQDDTTRNASPRAPMTELLREKRMGGVGTETTRREIRRISLRDLDTRHDAIAAELWSAATDIGFFQIVDHGIDADTLDRVFAASERFFALPTAVKERYPLRPGTNAGWEYSSQVRPSVGTPDQKESFQVTRPRMDGLWPSDTELEGFRDLVEGFERRCWEIAMRVLGCFAPALGFDRDFFTRAHDPASTDYQSTLRLLHYYPFGDDLLDRPDIWRAGAHTDFDALTLLFQRSGQGGLQVLPGAESDEQAWTSVEPSDDAITCNIGDMLMRWSDDRLPSNFHRVRSPRRDEYRGARHTIAFFAQANRDVVIEGPGGKYPPITAHDYLQQRIAANFARR